MRLDPAPIATLAAKSKIKWKKMPTTILVTGNKIWQPNHATASHPQPNLAIDSQAWLCPASSVIGGWDNGLGFFFIFNLGCLCNQTAQMKWTQERLLKLGSSNLNSYIHRSRKVT